MASADSPSKPYSLAIVGGGISGLALAIALLQHNVPLTIYEAASHLGKLHMSPKIYQAFLKCKTGNAYESKANSWFTVRVGDARKADKDGYVREGKKVGDPVFEILLPPGGERGGVYRAHFLDELVKDVPDHVAKFDKRLVDMEEADGSTAQHTAVIGDNPASEAVFSGKYAYRGLIPMDEAVELLGDEAARNSQMFLGYHGHLLTFPISHGKIMNVVAFNSRETWDSEKWVVTTSKQDMQADFAEWGPHVQKIIGAMQNPDIWALFMHPPCETYTKGRVCLLGDAAHATTPHQGAGAGMCMEDAHVLAGLIKDANSTEELMCAFRTFDEVRRERTQKLVTTSYETGQVYDFELLGDDLDKIEEKLFRRGCIGFGNLMCRRSLELAREIMKNKKK
ncbi:hypothetical protein J3E73DRAFT_413018 [Bipolaris maydis]|nr:hypothetical protein J3E73DRAFT_413018 [Bipolaris maydis]